MAGATSQMSTAAHAAPTPHASPSAPSPAPSQNKVGARR